MALPAGLSTVTVTGTWLTPDGTPRTGTVTFTPEPSVLTSAAHGVFVLGSTTAQLDGTGSVSVELLATDDPDVTPVDWTYRVEQALSGSAGTERRSFPLSLPEDAPDVDLPAVAPAADPSEGDFLVITGPQGPTGPSPDPSGLSTGIASGGRLAANAGDPAAIDITAVDGFIADFLAGDQSEPVVTRVQTADQTVALDAASLLRSVTWWLMDSSANIIQQGTTPTPEQRRTHLLLGVTTFFGGAVVVTQTLPVILAQPANQLADLMTALGPFSISGNSITANGANLMINQSSGQMFARAFSHFVSGALTNNPHIVDTQAQAPSQFRYITATGTVFGPLINTVDVANFDNAGVITPIGGGSNTASVHRLWLFGTGEASTQLAFQYGQTTHASLTAAAAAIGQDGHVVNPLIVGNGALIAHVVATRSATDLSDPAQAVIRTAGKFATP